jgi:hypothetical protein
MLVLTGAIVVPFTPFLDVPPLAMTLACERRGLVNTSRVTRNYISK